MTGRGIFGCTFCLDARMWPAPSEIHLGAIWSCSAAWFSRLDHSRPTNTKALRQRFCHPLMTIYFYTVRLKPCGSGFACANDHAASLVGLVGTLFFNSLKMLSWPDRTIMGIHSGLPLQRSIDSNPGPSILVNLCLCEGNTSKSYKLPCSVQIPKFQLISAKLQAPCQPRNEWRRSGRNIDANANNDSKRSF